MKKKQLWMTVGIAALCAAAFFFVGMSYGKGTAANMAGGRGAFASSTRGGFGGARNGGGGFVAGTIISTGNGSLTVQLPNGNSENVFYSSSTSIVKPSPAKASDLTTGAMVMIGGSTNSDGSVTASTIQIRTGSTGSPQVGSSTSGFGGRGQ